jgi:hypothetical protein
MGMSNAEVGRLAESLGHTRVTIAETESGRRFTVSCTCGYGAPQSNGRPSVTRATFAEAVRTGQHHLRSSVTRALSEARRNGRVAPGHGVGAAVGSLQVS